MATLADSERMEYEALMNRGRDAERTSQLCWTLSGLAAACLMSWGVQTRNPALMLPVVLASAYGFYAMLFARHQVRLIAGYIKEFFETRTAGPQWFTRLGHLHVVPGFNPIKDGLSLFLANGTSIVAIIFAWLFSTSDPRSILMAGIVTGFGLLFGFHSMSETWRMHQTHSASLWHQVNVGPREVSKSGPRAASR
ncbi:MAG: hypothetical protein A2W00_05570 [Candidatus Eisenbacteria bacterium RBG_16_71_46]|nr:MAG: hypothetical protein A2W00_05570 [Candidatus Eisenbacteria bacterium RBG_16_71_46]OGF25470.1 MAG: hypothetical protein A2V63_00340 [Candidatus Eisenbacteria bacterium RBG_19FT_COMBO_70_11]